MADADRASLALDYGLVVGDDGEVDARRAVGDGPLTVVNLFALHDTARSDDGTTCTGVEAMLRYSATSGERLAGAGGHVFVTALPTTLA